MARLSFLLVFFVGLVAVITNLAGCAKDYSFEGSPPPPLVKPDTIVAEVPLFPPCINCVNLAPPNPSTWQFKLAQTQVCGTVTKALISIEKTSFTFFGPSACSDDSGFIASVYLNEALVGDKVNLTAGQVAFYYYDNVSPSYVLVSKSGSPFTLTINNYSDQTKIATGSFSGTAFTVNGDKKEVKDGQFKIQF